MVMENNSQESNQNTNYQPQNQGQAYPQPQNAPPANAAAPATNGAVA
ncbi:MAG: hypothetical protein HFJ07_11660 [Lachnospiraceae bacterium]|nr:hypothetical protein [Lachnospiraceae bacterium]